MSMDTAADRWFPDADALWESGRHQQAIELLLGRINAVGPSRSRGSCIQFCYYLFLLGDFAAAEPFLRELAAIWPQDAEIVENLAVVANRQGKSAEAIPLFERAVALRPASVNAWDGLASSRSLSKDYAGARQAGDEALRLKDAAARPLMGWALPAMPPREFLASRPQHHVISFSIWGTNPRYLRGALRNLLLIPDLYLGWQARFYVDGTVPAEFVSLARRLGAEVCPQPERQTLRQKLCWRFQVANDPAVGRFQVRDCDAVVSLRERLAVQEWLESDRYFHVMRDWWTHTELALAGMWGGVAGALPDLGPLVAAYQPAAKETANVDQWFLRECLWDALRRSVLVHDRCYRGAGGQAWPIPDPPGNAHVGQDEFAEHRRQQDEWLAPWIERYPWLRIT